MLWYIVIAPVLVLAVPKVRALAPCTVTEVLKVTPPDVTVRVLLARLIVLFDEPFSESAPDDALPIVIPVVLAVPMLIAPLAVAPEPALMVTPPPFLVPDAPVADPPWRVRVPPVTVVVPEPSPPLIVTFAPLLDAPEEVPGFMVKAVAVVAEAVVISAV